MDDDPYKALSAEERAYVGLHDAMMALYYQKKHNDCARLAEQLLTKANLPVLIRARCHMVLSTRRNNKGTIEHAERAVELLDVEARNIVVPEAFPQEQLDSAHRCLEAAKKRAGVSQDIQGADITMREGNEVSTEDHQAITKAVSGLRGSAGIRHGLATPGSSRVPTGHSENPSRAPGASLPTPRKDREGEGANQETAGEERGGGEAGEGDDGDDGVEEIEGGEVEGAGGGGAVEEEGDG